MSNRGRILAIDDTSASLRLLSDMLKDEGYEVRSAINGKLALKSAFSNPPELVLLDIRMPEMDGFEVCRRLKAHPETQNIPVIFVSAMSDIDEKVQGFQLGAVDFVTKPYQREELLARVNTHLDVNRLRNHLEDLVKKRTLRLQESEEMLRASLLDISSANAQLRTLVQAIPDLVWAKDPKGVYLVCNTQFERFYGAKEAEIIGKTDYDFLSREQADVIYENDRKAIQSGKFNIQEESLTFSGNGYHGQFEIIKTPMFDQAGELIGLLGIARDITERKQAAEEIERLAFYDPLTNLPNRRLLHDRLLLALATSAHHSNHGAVLFVDLDNFKALNDIRGHNIGDLLLIEVASRLQASVREGDTVARLGGDEFVVILGGLSEDSSQAATQTKTVGNKILASISQPYMLDGYEYHCSTSIGISLFRNQDSTVDELLKRTDTAMYQAKSSGRNSLRFYDPVMQAALEVRTALENDLRHALEENQFRLYYQMQIDQAKHVFGAEVLIRWQHPRRGLISPMEFIPLAEETGLILPIGKWVLETACAQIKAWESDPHTCNLQLAVNVSARQFRQADFVDQVSQILRSYALNSNQLKLELTESLVLDDIDDTILKMQALRKIGVRFSLDDFGTGYSSLSYLTKLPLDQLKIDQSFVRNIGLNHSDAVIVQTIIGMADNLGIEVIAEGVETEDQRIFLEHHGCVLYQGYLFGKPVPVEEFQKSLNGV